MQLEGIGKEVKKIVTGDTVTVVTDENVGPLYLERCVQSLRNEGFDVYSFTIAPGEESKSGEVYLELLNYLAEIPLTRSDALVALGGGVVGDLTGFAAATYLRGIKVIQVPTTLLAAVDSSIGGKTAINLPAGKNLAGAFHQPALVYRDVKLLDTLPADIYLDGMAEVLKYGIIADADLWEILCARDRLSEKMPDVIEQCANIKIGIVNKDEHDTGIRQLLNFGHTIGHAIEIASNFEISHGRAVAKGMARISEISARQGWCSKECADTIISVLKDYGFDLSIDYSNEQLYDIMLADKKRKGHYIDIVVPEYIGKCRLERLTTDELKEIL